MTGGPPPDVGGTPCQGGGGQGVKYSYASLEGLWIQAGGKKSLAPLMAAIAMAESSGCSAALNSIGACGLWQIHPRQAGCLNAQSNAKMAVAKQQSQGLTAWATYTNGAYKKFLRNGVAPNTPTGQGSGAAPAADCLIAIPSVGVAGVKAGGGCAVSKSEARAVLGAGLIVAGGLPLMVGALLLAAYGLKSAGAGKAAGRALEVGGAVAAVAGAPELGVPLAAAGSQVRRQGASRAATGAATARGKRQLAGQAKKAAKKGP
jgi:hypothetical protein